MSYCDGCAERDRQLREQAERIDNLEGVLASTADRAGVALRELGVHEEIRDPYTSFGICNAVVAIYDKAATLRSQLAAAEDDRRALDCAAGRWENAHADAQGEIERLKEARGTLLEGLTRNATARDEARAEVEDMKVKWRELRDANAALRERIASAEREVLNLEAFRDALRSQVSDLRAQLAAAQEEIERIDVLHADALHRVQDERDNLQSVLASVTDCVNTFCREHGVDQIQEFRTLQVRDGIERVVYAVLKRWDEARAEAERLRGDYDVQRWHAMVERDRTLEAENAALKERVRELEGRELDELSAMIAAKENERIAALDRQVEGLKGALRDVALHDRGEDCEGGPGNRYDLYASGMTEPEWIKWRDRLLEQGWVRSQLAAAREEIERFKGLTVEPYREPEWSDEPARSARCGTPRTPPYGPV